MKKRIISSNFSSDLSWEFHPLLRFSYGSLSSLSLEVEAHLDRRRHVAIDGQQDLVDFLIRSQHDSESVCAFFRILQSKILQRQIELQGHYLTVAWIEEVVNRALVRVVKSKEGLQTSELLKLAFILGHLHHLLHCEASAVRHVLRTVAAVTSVTPQDDNVLLLSLYFDVDLVITCRWRVDNFQTFKLRPHLFLQKVLRPIVGVDETVPALE